jgi:hypothetical protein
VHGDAGTNGKPASSGTITPGGWFYLKSVPEGEYYLVSTIKLVGRVGKSVDLYYPGTTNIREAVKVQVSAQPAERTFDFAAEKLPLVPIPILVETPKGSGPIQVEIYLEGMNGPVADRASLTGGITTSFGRRGESFRIGAEGFGDPNDGRPDHHSDNIPVVAKDGMKTVHVFFTDHY